jgi:hypothetical protein
VVTLVANMKELPKETFSKNTFENCLHKKHRLLITKWSDVKDGFLGSTAHDNSTVEMLQSREFHYKNKK